MRAGRSGWGKVLMQAQSLEVESRQLTPCVSFCVISVFWLRDRGKIALFLSRRSGLTVEQNLVNFCTKYSQGDLKHPNQLT